VSTRAPSSLKHRLFAAIAFACALAPLSAHAADNVTVQLQGGFARMLFSTEPFSKGTATINGNVVTIAFDRAISVDPARLQAQAPALISNARIDPDHKTLRLVLSQAAKLHVSTSGKQYAVDLAPTTFAGTPPDLPPPPKPPGPVDPSTLSALKVRAGLYQNFSRVVFDWPQNVNYTLSRTKDTLTVHFAGLGKPDFAPLTRIAPPWVKAGDWHIEGRGIAVTLAVDPGSRTHDFRDGTHVVIDVASPTADADTYTPPADNGKKSKPVALAALPTTDVDAAKAGKHDDPITPAAAAPNAHAPAPNAHAPAAQAQTQQPPKPLTQAQVIADTAAKLNGKPAAPEPAKPDPKAAPPAAPVPTDVTAQRTKDGATITFAKSPTAAVFMRGLTAWIVVDGAPKIDGNALKLSLGNLPDAVDNSTVNGASVLRIALKTPMNVTVHGIGTGIEVQIAPDAQIRAPAMEFTRGTDPTHQSLTTTVPGATHTIYVNDPDVGDTLMVVPGTPERAVLQPRDNLEFSVLQSASGLAVDSYVDDLSVTTSDSRVVITRRDGLSLTPQNSPLAGGPAMLLASDRMRGPTFLDLGGWARGDDKDFLEQQRSLMRQVAVLGADEANGARLQLARFFLAHRLAAETLGLIRTIQKQDPTLAQDPQLLTMRAAANYMMGRYKDAHNDLSADLFAGDRNAAFWRALTETGLKNWNDARDAFTLAGTIVDQYPAYWQTRYRLAQADVLLSTGHVESADATMQHLPHHVPDDLLLDSELIRARLYAQEGRTRDAALLFAAVEKGSNPYDSAQAVYYRTDSELADGEITREQAIDRLERLRFRWRGDALELATLRKLAQFYFGKQDWRDGLRILRVATQYFPDDDAGREAQDDMRNAFEDLFINGKADKLPPIQSLALFYDFIDLTPIGPAGDDMIRRMSDRLVAVDLLGPAEDLLKYQIDKRLDGMARSQVATRLATVYLMDKKAEDALSILAATRISGLPDDVNHQRMLLEARALAGLKRWDQAIDMIADDPTSDAAELRAEIYWQSGNWAVAGQSAEQQLGSRFSDAAPLTGLERNTVMRAAVAYSLASDQTSLDRLRTNFLPKMKTTPDASAFNVVTQKIDTQGMAFKDAAAQIASVDTLKSFLSDFKKAGGT
jgi:tetratricopeptide (TPR) repeat protein